MANNIDFNPSEGKNSLGYSKAQKWYSDLRHKFLSELSSKVSQNIVETVDSKINDLNNLPYKGSLAKESTQKIIEIINQFFFELFEEYQLGVEDSENIIQNYQFDISLGSIRLSTVKETQKSVKKEKKKKGQTKIEKNLEKKQKEIQKKIFELKDQLAKEIIKTYGSKGELQNLFLKIAEEIMGTDSNFVGSEVRFSALMRQAHFLAKLGTQKHLLGEDLTQRVIKLQGYIAEDLEYQALLELFHEISNLYITPGGDLKNIQGQDTTFDIVLSFKNVLENLEGFRTQITATEDFTALSIEEERKILDGIQYYGEQIKTFILKTGTKAQYKTGDYLGYKIGGREQLFQKYLNQYGEKEALRLKNNISFLGQYQNIVSVFHADTLFMRTGNQRMYTSDFIAHFRENNYHLLFGLSKSKDETQYNLSGEVMLDLYSNYTKQKGKIRLKPKKS